MTRSYRVFRNRDRDCREPRKARLLSLNEPGVHFVFDGHLANVNKKRIRGMITQDQCAPRMHRGIYRRGMGCHAMHENRSARPALNRNRPGIVSRLGNLAAKYLVSRMIHFSIMPLLRNDNTPGVFPSNAKLVTATCSHYMVYAS